MPLASITLFLFVNFCPNSEKQNVVKLEVSNVGLNTQITTAELTVKKKYN